MSTKQFRFGVILVLLLTLVAHYGGLSGKFVEWDDPSHITKNPPIRALTLANVQTMFGTSIAKLYCPVTWLSYAVDYAIWGREPFGYHLMNLLLHLANIFLVVVLIRRLTNNLPAALLTAALFGVHPLRVESVAWATERKDVLFCFFYLGGLLMYGRWATKGGKGNYWSCCGLFLLSTLSKSTGVTFPVVLLLLDYFVYHRLAIKEKIPFFIGSLAVGIVTTLSQAHGAGGTVLPTSVLPMWARMGLVGFCSLFYVRKFFWPFHLCAIYPPFDDMGWTVQQTIGWLLALVVVTGVIFALRRRAPLLLPCWLFYLVTLSLTIGLIPVGAHVVADRFSYLPLIGLALPLSVGITALPKYFLPLAGVLMLGLAVLTWQRTKVWHDTDTLYTSVLAEHPDNYIALVNLAEWYNRLHRTDEATTLAERAVVIAPNGLIGRIRLARAYIDAGRYQDAINALQPAIDHGINETYVWKQLNECYVGLHDEKNAAFTAEKMKRAPREAD